MTDTPTPTPPPTPYRARLAHRPALDGVRGLSVILVLAFHNGFSWVKAGFLWVPTFFTLSAFLVTSLLVVEHEDTGRVSLSAFWVRRFRRLMPGALLAIAGIAAFGAWFADPVQLQKLRGDGLGALFYVANWRFIASGQTYADQGSPSPFQHFWSLSIEEQFYIGLPLAFAALVVAFRGRWAPVAWSFAALTAVAAAWTAWTVATAPSFASVIERVYFGTDTHVPELTAGVVLAIGIARWTPGTHTWIPRLVALSAPLALVAMLAVTWSARRTDPWLYPYGLLAWTVGSALLITSAHVGRDPLARLLGVAPLAWIGRLSYGTYLYHFPIFLVLDEARTGLGGWALFALRVAVTVPLAWASDRFVERPIREGRRLTGRAPLVATPAAVAAVVLALVLVTVDPPRPAVDLTSPDVVALPEVPGGIDDVQIAPDPPAASTGPAPRVVDGPVRMLVVGDSTAFVIGNALTRWAEQSAGAAVAWNRARRGCGIVRGGVTDRMGDVGADPCEDWATLWAADLEQFKPHVVVVLTGGWDWNSRKLPEWPDFEHFGDPDFDRHVVEEYGAAADLLSSRGAIVSWLTAPCYELEGFGEDPRHLNDPILLDVVRPRADRVVTLDLFGQLCPGGAFTDTLGGLPNARPDGAHLSDEAADWLVRTWLGPRLLDVVRGEAPA